LKSEGGNGARDREMLEQLMAKLENKLERANKELERARNE